MNIECCVKVDLTTYAFTLLILAIPFPPVLGGWPPSNSYHRPIYGGYVLDIDRFYFRSSYYTHYGYCTIGYVARSSSGDLGYVSAGHCVDGRLDGSNWVWILYQPNHIYRSAFYSGFPSEVYGNFEYIDTVFVKYSNVQPKVLTLNAVNSPYNASVTSYYSWTGIHSMNELKNKIIVKTGKSTGVTYGEFVTSFYRYRTSDGAAYKFIIFITNYAYYGDSGGPVYTLVHDRIDGMWVAYVELVGILIGRGYLQEYGTVSVAVSVDGIRIETGIQPEVMQI